MKSLMVFVLLFFVSLGAENGEAELLPVGEYLENLMATSFFGYESSLKLLMNFTQLVPLGVTTEKVKELESINSEAFVNEHVSLLDVTPAPLILRSVAKTWPAFTKWTDEYLLEHYGILEMKIDRVKNKSADRPPQGDVCLGRDTLAHFLHTYTDGKINKFVDSELPTPLYKYVKIPPPLGCAGLKDSLVEVDMKISTGEHQSMLRKDMLNSFTCVLNGTVEWKLMEPLYNDYMYEGMKGDSTEVANIRYSTVNIKYVNFKKYPKIKQVPKVLTAELQPGDCLYVPAGYWHTEVTKSEKNMDVKFIMRETKDINFTDVDLCGEKIKAVRLDQVDPDWQYKGKGRMSKGHAPFAYYMELVDRFFLLNSKILKHETIHNVLSHVSSYLPYSDLHMNDRAVDLYGRLTEIAGNLDYTSDNILPLIKREEWRELISEFIQPIIPSNTYDHEYIYYSGDKMLEIFHNISELNSGIIEKRKFIEAYVGLGGHEKLANTVWNAIDEEAKDIDIESSDVDINNSLDKYYLYYQEGNDYHEEDDIEGDVVPVEENVAPKDEL